MADLSRNWEYLSSMKLISLAAASCAPARLPDWMAVTIERNLPTDDDSLGSNPAVE
jgi:hypothetical protein